MMLNGTVGSQGIGKIIPNTQSNVLTSIDHNGYGSQSSFNHNQQQPRSNNMRSGPISNQGSFYSSIGG